MLKLQDVDLEKLTIDDISKISEKSKASIYSYFSSKEDVIYAACETRVNLVYGIINDIKDDRTAPLEIRYSRLIETFSKGLSDITISFMKDVKKYYPMSWELINDFSDHFVELLETLYSEGMESGIFRKMSIPLLKHLDKHFVTNIVTDSELFEDSSYTLDYLVRDYLKLRLVGIEKP